MFNTMYLNVSGNISYFVELDVTQLYKLCDSPSFF